MMSKSVRCPYCCEEIPSSSTVCPYCGEPLTQPVEESVDGTSVSGAENESEKESKANLPSSKNLPGWSEMNDKGKMTVVIISIVMILSIVIAISFSVANRTQSDVGAISSEYSSSGTSSTSSKTDSESSVQLFTDSETGLKYVYFDEDFGKGVASALNFPDRSLVFCLKTDNELVIHTEKYRIFWPQFTDALVSKLQNTYSKYQFYAESGQYTLVDEALRNESGRFISKANNEVCDIVMDMSSDGKYPSIKLYVYLSSTDTPFDVMTVSGFQDCKLLFNVFKTLTNNLDSARRFFNSGSASSNSSSYGAGSSSTVSAESLKSKKVECGLSEGRTVDLENMTLAISDEDLGALTISGKDIIPFGEICRKWLDDIGESFTLETQDYTFALWRIGADNVFAHTLTMSSWQPNFAGSDVIYELYINDEIGYENVNMSFTEGDLRAIISVIFD